MQVVIVGAGVAGLTLADKLLDNNITPVIIEREDVVGGLARSFVYSENTTFDIGPHRFHTDDPDVQDFIRDVLREDQISISRDSQLYLFGKYMPWPLTMKNIFSLPPLMVIKSALDLFIPKKAKSESLEDYIIEKYGKTLYNIFFKPYTEKFVDYTCGNMHRDWAITGINRATIDKKVNTTSLIGLIKSVMFSKPANTKFIYPESGGNGVFCEHLANRITGKGGRIILASQVERLVKNGQNKITAAITDKGEEINCDHIFWSGSLDSLRTVGKAPLHLPRLHYMSAVYFNYVTDYPIDNTFQWCYFGGKDVEVDRVSVPRHFNPRLVPEGKEALCVEVCCLKDSPTWRNPTRMDCVVETFMRKVGLIKSLNNVVQLNIEKIQETYPLYTLNYIRKLNRNFMWVNETMPNLTLLGRTGRFWYNNMDHSIDASLRVAKLFGDDFKKGDVRGGEHYAVEDRYLEG